MTHPVTHTRWENEVAAIYVRLVHGHTQDATDMARMLVSDKAIKQAEQEYHQQDLVDLYNALTTLLNNYATHTESASDFANAVRLAKQAEMPDPRTSRLRDLLVAGHENQTDTIYHYDDLCTALEKWV